jgi:hypothetical protein
MWIAQVVTLVLLGIASYQDLKDHENIMGLLFILGIAVNLVSVLLSSSVMPYLVNAGIMSLTALAVASSGQFKLGDILAVVMVSLLFPVSLLTRQIVMLYLPTVLWIAGFLMIGKGRESSDGQALLVPALPGLFIGYLWLLSAV